MNISWCVVTRQTHSEHPTSLVPLSQKFFFKRQFTTTIKEQLNRDIPSEIHHEVKVKQQVHWFIVGVKKLRAACFQSRRLAKKRRSCKQKWVRKKNCAETNKKARQGSWGPSDHLGPPEKRAPVTIRSPSDSQSSLVTLLNSRAPLTINALPTVRSL